MQARFGAVALVLFCVGLGGVLGCEDVHNLGEVRPVAALGQDWDADGVVAPLPDDPGEGDYLVDFGRVVLLQRSTRIVILSNEASAKDTLHWNSVELAEGSSPNFYLDMPPLNDLLPGEFTYFTVHFIPNQEQIDRGAVLVRSNDPDRPEIVVSLVGEGVSPDIQVCLVGPEGELCNDRVAPANLSLDFGMNDLGATSERQFLIRNLGVHELAIRSGGGQEGVDFGQGTSSEFSLDPARESFTLAPGAERRFTIAYVPYDGGADRGRLEVSSNDPDEPLVTIDLLGNGLAPKICPEPPFLVDFGSISVNSISRRTYTFTSCGNQVLSVTELSLDSGLHGFFSFAVGVATPFDLSPGEAFDVELVYAPTAEGAHAGKLTIRSNDPNAGEGWIDLVGRSTPIPSCDVYVHPSTVDFGSVSTSGFSNQTVTITNTGDANCRITEVQGPTGGPEFTFPSVPFTGLIPPGEMRQFAVRYTPAGEGADQGSLTIVCPDDPDEGQTVVNLQGQGVQPPPCDFQVDPGLLNYGLVPVGGRVELTSTLFNFGSAECFVTDWSLA